MRDGEAGASCRAAACREASSEGGGWSLYLINDGELPLDWASLDEIGYEWGDWGSSEVVGVRVAALAPGAHALLWHDDGSGAELRMTLSVRVCVAGREQRLAFEFPRLYRMRNLPVVEGLGKSGFAVAAEPG